MKMYKNICVNKSNTEELFLIYHNQKLFIILSHILNYNQKIIFFYHHLTRQIFMA